MASGRDERPTSPPDDDVVVMEIEDSIDRMQLMALDVYTMCRDRISEIKVNDAKRSTAKLVERLNARLADRDGKVNDDEDNHR